VLEYLAHSLHKCARASSAWRGSRVKNPHKSLTRLSFVTGMAEHAPSPNSARTGPLRLVRHQNAQERLKLLTH
jgi:hypothetical protein